MENTHQKIMNRTPVLLVVGREPIYSNCVPHTIMDIGYNPFARADYIFLQLLDGDVQHLTKQ
jgi:hypothetical protein